MNEKPKNSLARRLRLLSSFDGEKEFLLENISMLVDSGMDVGFALEAVQREIKSKAVREMVGELKQEILEGSPLWSAFEKTGLFPQNVISLIRLGEQSGQLPRNLKAIALRERKERAFRSKVRSAMLYPVFVFSLTMVIGVGIAWFLLPKLAGVFSSLDIELPWITRTLIRFGTFLKDYGTVAVPAFVILASVFFYLIFFFRRTKFIGERIIFLFPAARMLVVQIELSRFGYVLATLIDAGLSITEAVESLRDATSFSAYRKLYQHLLGNINEGKSLRDSLESYPKSGKLIPFSVQQMVVFAEQSGNLVPTFRAIGENYEEKTETTTKDLATLLEPVLLVVVWLGVVGVALAVILPIYSLLGGISEKNSPSPAPGPNVPVEAITEQTESPESVEVVPEEKTDEVLEESGEAKSRLEILSTETGYLNVRELPSKQSKQVGRVSPGERFDILAEADGWIRIKLDDEAAGWISSGYAQKIEE